MIINPGKEKGEPGIPGHGILAVNPGEAKAFQRFAQELGSRKHFLFNSRLAVVSEAQATAGFFVAGPAVGAPMAVLALEKLIALGAESIIVFGSCGSLHEKLKIGDILLPTTAVSDEGTSSHYPLAYRAESSTTLRRAIGKRFTEEDLAYIEAPVWTTDAPYRESREKVWELAAKGVLGVDMEFAALNTVASFRKIELAAVLIVSDELWQNEWNPGFRTARFKSTNEAVIRILVDMFKKKR